MPSAVGYPVGIGESSKRLALSIDPSAVALAVAVIRGGEAIAHRVRVTADGGRVLEVSDRVLHVVLGHPPLRLFVVVAAMSVSALLGVADLGATMLLY